MQQTRSLRALSPAAFGASVAMAMMGGASAPSLAQGTPEAAPAAASEAISLPQIDVGSTVPTSPANPLRGTTGLGRLQGPIQDIPQSVAVVPREVLQQQNTTTLEQALRNIPGITSTVGEGGGGVQGDQLRIRGFNAQNDIFSDGLRDFGSYSRDTFDTEDVAVFFGPSGITFGAGSVGGAVNLNSRMPFLGSLTAGEASGGSGSFFRGTADVNRQIGESSAVRLNVMGQTRSNIVERDHQDGTRFGFAPSVAFGLGTNVKLTLQYLYYEYDQTTDTGVPTITNPTTGQIVVPTEAGLRRANWYGSMNDRDKVTLNRVTARAEWNATDWLTFYNDTRASFLDRDFAYTILSCTAACATNFFRGSSFPANYTVSGASGPYSQSTMGLQNITTGVARFTTGSLRHELTAGLDAWYESTDRDNLMYSPARPGGNLWNPVQAFEYFPTVPSTAASATRNIDTTTVALFASDRIWFTPEISLLAGLRWSSFQTDYTAYGPGTPVTSLNSTTTAVDPRAALIYEPNPNLSFYASYSTSSSPPGNNFAVLPGQANFNNTQLDPERNTIYELGAKWTVLEQRLGLTASLFRIEKDNARTTDPLTGSTVATGDKQQNQGLELGAVGRITPQWLVSARYTYMDSEITEAGTVASAALVGNQVQFVPRNALALWTTYDLFPDQRYNLTVGGGVTYRSSVYLNNQNTAEVPDNFSLDAMVSHRIGPNWRAQFNIYNITNELNYDMLFTNRVVPSPGRSFVLSLSGTF
ncbi:TonB-dependent siderophore receptor [Roseomonas sp. AR75]|uniref:TonB-dependent receptor n=1 Tax=Roseomonas sp. AR75 TaxID=2562311 RepID=UPI0010C08A18|nr:TonB-dependent siderophore receptor [Roseomonas sp. AR75]